MNPRPPGQRDATTRATNPLLGVVGACLRALSLCLALLMLAAPAARSFVLFRCVYTGAARPDCCCGSTDHADSDVPRLSRASCCEVERVDASLPASSAGPELPVAVVPALTLSSAPAGESSRALALASPARASRAHYRERTRAGPPLTIIHRRLLI